MKARLFTVLLVASTAVSWSVPVLADDHAAALRHYQAGEQAYVNAGRIAVLPQPDARDEALSEYRRSVDEFVESYKAEPRPVTMFTLGQAYRALGDLEHAVNAYRQYLVEAPNGSFRDDALKQIRDLEEAIAKKQAAQVSPPRGVPSAKDESTSTLVEGTKPRRHWYQNRPALFLTGGGLAVAAVGTAVALHGLAYSHDADTAVTLPLQREFGQKSTNFEVAGVIVAGVGAAALVTGIVIFALEGRKQR